MKNKERTSYAQMGIAAMLPGMQFMIERMQAELDEMRAMLNGAQSDEPRQLGRPKGKATGRSGWSDDPAERSAEMKRRIAKRKGLHPRDPEHPDHTAWLKKISKTRRDAWKALSPAQHKKQLASMQAGQRKARQKTGRQVLNGAPTVKLEATA